jgi:ribosomal protein S7
MKAMHSYIYIKIVNSTLRKGHKQQTERTLNKVFSEIKKRDKSLTTPAILGKISSKLWMPIELYEIGRRHNQLKFPFLIINTLRQYRMLSKAFVKSVLRRIAPYLKRKFISEILDILNSRGLSLEKKFQIHNVAYVNRIFSKKLYKGKRRRGFKRRRRNLFKFRFRFLRSRKVVFNYRFRYIRPRSWVNKTRHRSFKRPKFSLRKKNKKFRIKRRSRVRYYKFQVKKRFEIDLFKSKHFVAYINKKNSIKSRINFYTRLLGQLKRNRNSIVATSGKFILKDGCKFYKKRKIWNQKGLSYKIIRRAYRRWRKVQWVGLNSIKPLTKEELISF